MRMIRPQLEALQVTIAEDQDDFKPVTAALVRNGKYNSIREDGINTTVLAFRPSEAERAAIAAGADLYLAVLTFAGPMQGVILLAGKEAASAAFNVPLEDGTA